MELIVPRGWETGYHTHMHTYTHTHTHTRTVKLSTRVSKGETRGHGGTGPQPYAILARSSTACWRVTRFLLLGQWKRGSLNQGRIWLWQLWVLTEPHSIRTPEPGHQAFLLTAQPALISALKTNVGVQCPGSPGERGGVLGCRKAPQV